MLHDFAQRLLPWRRIRPSDWREQTYLLLSNPSRFLPVSTGRSFRVLSPLISRRSRMACQRDGADTLFAAPVLNSPLR